MADLNRNSVLSSVKLDRVENDGDVTTPMRSETKYKEISVISDIYEPMESKNEESNKVNLIRVEKLEEEICSMKQNLLKWQSETEDHII